MQENDDCAYCEYKVFHQAVNKDDVLFYSALV